MKKIVFFDGDGTLWYPKLTGRTVKPWWIYLDESTKENYLDHMEIDPNVITTLSDLKKRGVKLILLSTHPDSLENAADILKSKVDHFNLHDLFDAHYATSEYPEAKGEKMLEILADYGINKDDALMIGDSYKWDYKPAKDCGVDAILIDSDYHQANLKEEPVEKIIRDFREIIKFIL